MTAEFRVEASQLAVWDSAADRWAFESGVCRLLAGASSADIRAEAELRLDGEPLSVRQLGNWTAASSYDEARGLAIDACRDGGDSVRPAASAVLAEAGNGADAAGDSGGAGLGEATGAGAGGARSWARYERGSLPAGPSRFEARVSGAGGGSIELRLGGPDGELLATCDVPRTGGPQAWTTVAAPLALPAGFVATAKQNGGWLDLPGEKTEHAVAEIAQAEASPDATAPTGDAAATPLTLLLRGEIGLARFRIVSEQRDR
ncbi:carbohydrate-binding protein [Paenibacillus albicereus]|uniref:Carbohydrate-binding protein n=1 Tax=Paenibacillus albicereus TaxID=2726185 RepID=A0A6H2H4A5_9BACL|nr:carbohydrate-binding protein [Paenibacillus albicereus]